MPKVTVRAKDCGPRSRRRACRRFGRRGRCCARGRAWRCGCGSGRRRCAKLRPRLARTQAGQRQAGNPTGQRGLARCHIVAAAAAPGDKGCYTGKGTDKNRDKADDTQNIAAIGFTRCGGRRHRFGRLLLGTHAKPSFCSGVKKSRALPSWKKRVRGSRSAALGAGNDDSINDTAKISLKFTVKRTGFL